jgi:UDP-N-acetylglucosamine 2-epimerase (non-hydrolysing)
MTLTEHARRYLLAEGIRGDMVIKIGSPMKEVLTFYGARIEQSGVLGDLTLQPGKYFVVSTHREENVDSDDNLRDLLDTFNAISDRHKFPIIVSTHPRTRKRLEKIGVDTGGRDIRFLKPLGLFDYVRLQKDAYCVLSDSGTITEESSILRFPAVTIRQAHERPEGMDEGTLIMCGLKTGPALDAIAVVRRQFDEGRLPRLVGDYDTDNVSLKVVRIILSYTDFVNRVIWRKSG